MNAVAVILGREGVDGRPPPATFTLDDPGAESIPLPADPASAYAILLALTGEGRPGFILALPGDAVAAAALTAMMTVLGRYRDRIVVQAADGMLRDVPFPRCRYLLLDRMEPSPERWEDLTDWANVRLSRELPVPELFLQPDSRTIWAGRSAIVLSPSAFCLYWLLALRCRNGLPWLRGSAALAEELHAFALSTGHAVMPDLPAPDDLAEPCLRPVLDEVANALADALALDQGRECCLPVQGLDTYGLALPPEKVTCPRNY
jgi:hypothetical protein